MESYFSIYEIVLFWQAEEGHHLLSPTHSTLIFQCFHPNHVVSERWCRSCHSVWTSSFSYFYLVCPFCFHQLSVINELERLEHKEGLFCEKTLWLCKSSIWFISDYKFACFIQDCIFQQIENCRFCPIRKRHKCGTHCLIHILHNYLQSLSSTFSSLTNIYDYCILPAVLTSDLLNCHLPLNLFIFT